MSINQVCLIGRAGRDPEIKYLEGNKQVLNISMAVTVGKDLTDWHEVEAWDKTADIINRFVKKGQLFSVSGRLKVDTWQDRDNGEERTKVVIVATGVTLIGGKDNNSNEDDF